MVQVYLSDDVDSVDLLFDTVCEIPQAGTTVSELLSTFAEGLVEAHQARDHAAFVLINNHCPDLSGQGQTAIWGTKIGPLDARDIVARDHGFNDWHSVPNRPLDLAFEKAVDALVHGHFNSLHQMLKDRPQWVHERSGFGHQATLLHYLAANGTEIRRQKVPENAADMASLLLEFGADVNAVAKVYGGEFDTAALLSTSAHPRAAGVAREIAYVLTKAGATFQT